MLHPSVDTGERQLFTERTLQAAAHSLSLPEVALRTGKAVNGLRHLVSRLVVPYIVDGEVRLPKGAKRVPDVVPIIALQPGESVVLGGDFIRPTPLQSRRAAEIIDGWQPIGFNGRTQVETMVRDDAKESKPLTFEATAQAMATAFASAIVFHPEKEKYRKPPAQDVGWLACQPLLVLHWNEGESQAEPDLVAHELTHLAQKMNRPIRLFGSQDDVLRDRLRDELEAYHVGANVRLAIDPDIIQRATNQLVDTDINLQVAIEATRLDVKAALGELETDPFGPSKLIIRKMDQRFGLQNMVHHAFNYEAVRNKLLEEHDSTQPED